MKEEEKRSIKYKPEYFIDDFSNLMDSLQEKVRIMNEIEFTTKQKAQIAGLVLGITAAFSGINCVLQEWGFLPKRS